MIYLPLGMIYTSFKVLLQWNILASSTYISLVLFVKPSNFVQDCTKSCISIFFFLTQLMCVVCLLFEKLSIFCTCFPESYLYYLTFTTETVLGFNLSVLYFSFWHVFCISPSMIFPCSFSGPVAFNHFHFNYSVFVSLVHLFLGILS